MTPEDLSNLLNLLFSFLAGILGSSAYFTALYFKFIGFNEDNRNIILEPFKNKKGLISKKKVLWYCVVGGFISMVFQINVPTFVPVQSLIIGATWPAIVSQFLSGRMASPTTDELHALENSKYDKEKEKELVERFKAIKESFERIS